jgi:Uma2 family endonuclease
MDTSSTPTYRDVETLGMDLSPGAGIFERMHVASAPNPSPRTVRLVLDVPATEEAWVLPEEDMPESSSHRDTVRLLELILLAFVARTGRNAHIAGNLACRWYEADARIGVDPDVALIEPAPPGGQIPSLRTWEPGHVPPRFAIEVVSATTSKKAYQDAPAKYAALGTRELVVFDPELSGPATAGGPFILQVWRRSDPGAESGNPSPTMERVYAGEGPARSEELEAWLVPMPKGLLRIADDEQGSQLWLTEAEQESAARKQAESARKQAESARKQAESARKQAESARKQAESARAKSARAAVEDICEAYGVPLDDARRAHLDSLDADALESLRTSVKRTRSWPL